MVQRRDGLYDVSVPALQTRAAAAYGVDDALEIARALAIEGAREWTAEGRALPASDGLEALQTGGLMIAIDGGRS